MLYLITNRHLIKRGDIYSVVSEAYRGGVDAVILREKDLSYNELLPIALKLNNITHQYGKKLIINSCFKTAQKIKADFFHIGYEDYLKQKLNLNNMPYGMSVHNIKEAVYAEQRHAQYVLASHIYPTKCKQGLKPKGLELIKAIKTQVKIPIIALGGISEKNIAKVIQAGAYGVAVMSAIMGSLNPYLSAKYLKQSMFK
ncbi:thiamine phosphate synthase [Clostridium sp. 'deep sea']|uniref:thiamine phosphate synthase n=1 Tax=Clostridium sp. 'deep sea' TaxID=2779445 RepID=UPI0018964907|nr:thiamine phosphate synthase [Clostridium sp. 'deep sea']QOR36741.1 thiamine phosphate synthase [Clostridium sp. 'deep sea']